ncbi:MAG TPA: rhomboid family intramembrane serine protease [Bacteroidia bacterium]|jgi:membrane associated rhomboid family serine protease|nr:rhomboid family intramembrane serine protease [Bacteroidia bacterium]
MSLRSEIDNLLGKNAAVLTRLIVINIIIFIIANLLNNVSSVVAGPLHYVTLPSSLREFIREPWSLFTYMFIHVELWHMVFNMLWLYWIGRIFVEFMGQQRLMEVFIFGGLAGGLLFMLVFNTLLTSYPSELLGASAGVMAVIVATAVLVPDYTIFLILIGPVKLKYLAIASFILTSIIDFSSNSGGKIAHIGGAAYGLLYMTQYRKGNDISGSVINFFKRIGRVFSRSKSEKHLKVSYSKRTDANKASKQRKIDEILDKISKSGYDSLSKEEKDFLFKSSKEN